MQGLLQVVKQEKWCSELDWRVGRGLTVVVVVKGEIEVTNAPVVCCCRRECAAAVSAGPVKVS